MSLGRNRDIRQSLKFYQQEKYSTDLENCSQYDVNSTKSNRVLYC